MILVLRHAVQQCALSAYSVNFALLGFALEPLFTLIAWRSDLSSFFYLHQPFSIAKDILLLVLPLVSRVELIAQ